MNEAKLDFWIKHNFNVLMIGAHGVGKTACVLEAFNRNKLKWLYFSASTLDPWVDFIGVPKEVTGPNGVKYLDLVRPQAFAEDSVEAIFLDEANRAPKKVRNAIMELIQFKSINGKKFKNLRIVWAAINPEDKNEENEMNYDVEKLDPAQKDRFHIQVEIPYKPSREYFKREFGECGTTAVDWWEDLTKEAKAAVSPRRLEYVLRMNAAGGDIRDILPNCANATKLSQELTGGSFKKNLFAVFNRQNKDEMQKFIKNPNNYDNCIADICTHENMMRAFFPFIDDERLAALVTENKAVAEFVDKTINEHEGKLDAVLASSPASIDQLKKK
jgi:hypothetical protein